MTAIHLRLDRHMSALPPPPPPPPPLTASTMRLLIRQRAYSGEGDGDNLLRDLEDAPERWRQRLCVRERGLFLAAWRNRPL